MIKARFVDQIRFARALLSSPKRTGAVAPTSRELADKMAAEIDLASGLPVLELGPGTGAITRAILARGIRPDNVWLVEYSPAFCRRLAAAFPGVHVIEGDAFDFAATLPDSAPPVFDCVISGLPLLNFAPEKRLALCRQALGRLPNGRPLVQFSYGVRAPVDALLLDGVAATPSRWVFRNLAPARVWRYTHPARSGLHFRLNGTTSLIEHHRNFP